MAKAVAIRRDANLIERLVFSKTFWLFFVIIGFSVPIYKSVNRTLPAPLPVLKKVPTFKLTNSFNKSFGTDELKGRIYIANFIFTNCPSSCLRLTGEMQKIQKRVRGLGKKVALVSFSVDPINDTPPVLFKYARKMHANPHIWTFLTGNKQDMKDIIIDGFNVPMGELEEVEGLLGEDTVTMFDIAHTEKFALVDHDGNIRGYYDSTKDEINQMMIDIGLLVNRHEFYTASN